MDVHDYDGVLRRAEVRLKDSEILETNKRAILYFEDYCFAKGISKTRICKYLDQLRFMASWLGKDFRETEKSDILRLIGNLERSDYSEKTKCDYKHALKRFFTWLEGDDEEIPKKVSWIKTTLKKRDRKLPEELLTEEEKEKLLRAASHPRDKAILATSFDLGCRPGETLTLKIKNVNFDEYGAYFMVRGKTGMRRVRAIYSGTFIQRWLECHPFREDPDSPLWVRLNAKSLENYLRYKGMASRLRDIVEKAGVKKRVHAYLFRHTRITEAASFMTESEMDHYFGWVQGSNMPQVYVHLSGREVDDKLLRHYKLKMAEEEGKDFEKPKRCPRCKEVNDPKARYCIKCGLPLTVVKNQMEIGLESTIMRLLADPDEYSRAR